jgi:hypothetical protein
MKTRLTLVIVAVACAVCAFAQTRSGRRFGGRGGDDGSGGTWAEGGYIGPQVRTPREIPSHSTGTPVWTNPKGFDLDTFTFVRVRRGRAPYAAGGDWATDTPDSDLNLSYRLQQMTSMRVNPDGRFIRLTDPDLSNYPFIYMVEPGSLYLSEPEIVALRKYLQNGGFLMLDDFWGDSEWANAEQVLKRVLPNSSFVELPLDHPIYHCVFEIKTKGQLDLRGFLGLSDAVPPGYENIDYVVSIKGDGSPEDFAEIHETVMKTSPNYFNMSRPIRMNPKLSVG